MTPTREAYELHKKMNPNESILEDAWIAEMVTECENKETKDGTLELNDALWYVVLLELQELREEKKAK